MIIQKKLLENIIDFICVENVEVKQILYPVSSISGLMR
jgi:hypothetical protein